MSDRLKDALMAILIGSIVSFLTTFLEGSLDVLRGMENNVIGGVAASLRYISHHIA